MENSPSGKLTTSKLSGNSLTFMETKFSLPCSQEPTLVHVLSQMNVIHILAHYLINSQFNITLPSTSRSPKWVLPSDISG